MSKSNYRFGGNVTNTVPASRQNIEQRTPSGVRPVASPVTPTGDVLGRSNGGELEMNKPKKMAFGGPSGRMAPGGSKPGAPVNQRVPGVMPQYGGPVPNMAPGGMNPNMAPGAGRMPMAGGFGGSAGPGGFSMDGRANQFSRGAMPQYGGRVPGMKKGGMASASSYEDMTGGAAGGIGRLEKSSIAAKTKSQKLKEGGKVRGYAEGNVVIADDDKAFKKAFADARRDKADEFMWRGTKYSTKLADGPSSKETARKAMATPRGAGGGPRGSDVTGGENQMRAMGLYPFGSDSNNVDTSNNNRGKSGGRGGPTSGGEAQMREMGLYPFGTDSNKVDTVRDEKYAKDNRGKSGGRSGTSRASANARADSNAKAMEAKIRRTEGNMAERDAAYNRMKDDAFRAMLRGEQRTSAIGGGMSEDPVYPMTSEEMRDAAREMNATVGGMRRGGKAKMAKGGKVKAFEGTARDMAEDKKLAKKYGMSKKAYEKSPIDAKHDKQKSMKGLKMGGMSKMAMGGYAAGGMSTAQDGMKGALRPKPSAMAMGGKVKRMAGGGNSMEGFSYPYDDQALRQLGRENERPSKKGFDYPRTGPMGKALARLDSFVGLAPDYPSFKMNDAGRPFKNRTDPKNSISGPSRKQSAITMGENKSQGETGSKDYKNARQLGTSPRGRKSGMSKVLVGSEMTDDIRNKERVNELGMKKGGKAEMHDKGCKCMACGGMAKKMAKGGAVGMTFGKPLPGTKVSSQKIRATTATGASMKKDGMKGQLRAKASGAKPTNMMKPLGMTKMASGGKVRGTGIAQRGTKFIGEV
jgi:hypothetical protein